MNEQPGTDLSVERSSVHVFVIFDLENDGELYDRLLDQSQDERSGFEVVAGSGGLRLSGGSREALRKQIGEVDQVIVICGEHTEASSSVFAELRIAQEEETPYFLLWGRRGSMCTKPSSARRDDGIYAWAREVLDDQIALALRNTRTEATARALRRVTPSPGRGTATPEASKRIS